MVSIDKIVTILAIVEIEPSAQRCRSGTLSDQSNDVNRYSGNYDIETSGIPPLLAALRPNLNLQKERILLGHPGTMAVR